ncbi:MAG: RNA polymerase factor sigma-54 [Actinobacteria bacterium]|nr:MAG: RNA polymerase factor sigma-54 [Actinomycetota bacterium]
MELRQRPELRHKVTLSPQVYQGLTMLAMPVLEVRELVENEILENPVLETEEDAEDAEESLDEAAEREAAAEDAEAWDEWLQMYDDLDSGERDGPRDPNAEEPNTEDYIGGVQTFDDHLLDQISMLDLTPEVERAARAIVGTLDDDGFFVGDCGEIAAVAGVTRGQAEAALGIVQQLDPPGVGARSLAEALKIQLDYLGIDEPVLVRIIDAHMPDVAASRVRKIARALRVSEDEISRLLEILRGLNPRPAGAFSGGTSPGYIVPDVTLRRFGDEWMVIPNGDAVPTLRVSARYRAMSKSDSTVDDETRKYLRERIRSAQMFIRNLDRRKDTISRIAAIVLEVQSDFFEDGKGPLRPLRLEDVAVELGVHLSTVSRGVTGKYVATPYGLFELKHFFSGGYRTSTGMDVAATTVKSRLKELVRDEDGQRPLSDQALAELLSEDGVTVARRTVAKYREELGIEPSWSRKRR